jgi:hypothetical protein
VGRRCFYEPIEDAADNDEEEDVLSPVEMAMNEE